VPLVLGEAYVVINFLARSFLFDTVGTDLFDAVSLFAFFTRRGNPLMPTIGLGAEGPLDSRGEGPAGHWEWGCPSAPWKADHQAFVPI
jgi:hypothetical protein